MCLIAFGSFSQTKSIQHSLDTWHNAAATADYDTYFSLMTEDAVFVGSDASEVWKGEEFKTFAKPYFDAGKAWTFSPVNRNVYTEGNFAWFDEVLNSDHMGLCRGSGVLIRNEDGHWKIKHYVLSLAIPNPLVDKIVKEKKACIVGYLKTQD